jgi:hypothetical protein
MELLQSASMLSGGTTLAATETDDLVRMSLASNVSGLSDLSDLSAWLPRNRHKGGAAPSEVEQVLLQALSQAEAVLPDLQQLGPLLREVITVVAMLTYGVVDV